MARKGENIYRRKDKRWEGRYKKYCPVTRSYKTGYVYGKTYGEVKDKLQAAKFAYLMPAAEKSLPFTEVSTAWLEKERLSVKQSTYAKYTSILKNHILPYFGDLQISGIDSIVINRFTDVKLQGTQPDGADVLTPKTVRDMLVILKSILHMASEEYGCGTKTANVALPKGKETQINVLDEKQCVLLETYLLNHPLDCRSVGLLICLYTGIRLGEICGLRWSDINLESGVLIVSRTLQRIQNPVPPRLPKTIISIDTPKTSNSLREIPLPPFLINILKEFRKNIDSGTEAFFLTGLKVEYLEPRTYQYFFQRICMLLKLEDIRFHSLRHTFATRCISVGFDIKTLSEILGHSNVNITLNRYVHSSLENKRRQMDMLDH